MKTLAVVLISKDQAWNVDRLVKSVILETADLASTQVVLVDSASVDGTAEAAARHGVDVLRLLPDQPLTPAAGRYVGYLHTTADFVLFLDGDMELCPAWTTHALSVMDERADVAVLTGRLLDVPPDAEPVRRSASRDARKPRVTEIRYSGGAAMFRRASLEDVGTFNPYLHSDEEPELCIRLRHSGYRVATLDWPIALHYSRPDTALSTLVGRWRRNLYLGAGQAIRYHLRSGLRWAYLRERGYGLAPGCGLLVGVMAAAASCRTRHPVWLRLWLLLVTGVVAADASRKRSVYATVHSLLLRLLILDGTVRGFLLAPREPRGYPARYERVEEPASHRT